MKRSDLIIVVLFIAFSLLTIFACSSDPNRVQQVSVDKKDGESCLMDKKCKIQVRRWEGSDGDSSSQGNVYYRCIVSNGFYEATSIGDKVLLKVNGKDCERLNP